MKRTEPDKPITLEGWELGFGELDEPIIKAVAEGLVSGFDDDPPFLSVETDDEGGIQLVLLLGILGDSGGNEWAGSFGKALKQSIEYDGGENAGAMAKTLRKLADEIEPKKS